jgi:phosphoribosylformylglycinamidine (FGAM) synthase PurS component
MNYTPNILRTGYENVVAHRTSELYSKVAAEAGKVTEVSDDALRVTYKDGTTDVYPLGLAIGEASGEYHRHTRVTDLKPGDTFNKGDVIGWDVQWFARDPFCPGQVAWKAGRMVRIALVEDQDVYEDSLAIAHSLAMEGVTPYIKPKRFAVDVNQNIEMMVKEGDSVDYDSILCNVEDDHLVADTAESAIAAEVNKLGIRQVRSSHHGKVIKIEVVYNSPLEEMSDSVRKFINAQDKTRKKKADIEGSDVTKGAVSNSLNVNKPILSPGKAFVTILVESMDPSTNADKYVLANQMKGTVGRIMHKPLMTEDGREVLIKSSLKGMFNRMVLSFRNKLVSCELTIAVSKQAIAIYRGK